MRNDNHHRSTFGFGAVAAGLAVLIALTLPHPTLAQEPPAQVPSGAEWVQMSRLCEAVLTEQRFAPMASYAPAPFTAGLPDRKDYAVYNGPRNLVAIARLAKDRWVNCQVRETVETDRTRWRQVAPAWIAAFAVAFPQTEYRWVASVANPARPFTGALRCRGADARLLVTATLEAAFNFRIMVTIDSSTSGSNLCAEPASAP